MKGIDVGSTQSEAAAVGITGTPAIILNARGEPYTPSVVYYQQKGDPLVGTDAYEQGFIDPDNTARNFKLKLGTNENVLNNGQVVTATDATAALIACLKEAMERQLNMIVEECVATCPANFKDDAKQALLEAFERNKIKVLRLVPEPTAAGYAYALGSAGHRSNILVYDFGGGTFDTSVLRVDGSEITVLATEGVAKLGGNDLNECLKSRMLDRVEADCGQRPTPGGDPLFFLDVEHRVERAKKSLGTRKEVPIVVAYNGKQIVEQVRQDEFHKAIAPLVQQSLDAIDRVLANAGLDAGGVDRLIMVGGTSRLPYIQDAVANHTGLVPKTDVEPEKAIAYGAALACMAELAKQGRTASLNGKAIPPPDMFVRDVTAHAVGCCVADTSGPNKCLRHAMIIPKNTAIPCQRVERFCLEHDDQTTATIEILQGEPDADRDDCLLIGEFVLDGLPKEDRRSPRIQLEYTIDANGMVTVTGTDTVSGRTQTISVDYKKGIKPKDKPGTV